jgi:hypothetical protein
MRYRLRTLLILLAFGPPLIWGGYWGWERYWPREQEGWQSDLIDLDLPHYGPGAAVADHPDLADPGEKPPY